MGANQQSAEEGEVVYESTNLTELDRVTADVPVFPVRKVSTSPCKATLTSLNVGQPCFLKWRSPTDK
jgi:hypothetical protein